MIKILSSCVVCFGDACCFSDVICTCDFNHPGGSVLPTEKKSTGVQTERKGETGRLIVGPKIIIDQGAFFFSNPPSPAVLLLR